MKKHIFRTSQYIEIFPYYKYEDLFPFSESFPPILSRLPSKDCYMEFNISVFDHYLEDNEYDEKMVTYDSFYKKKYIDKNLKKKWIYYKDLEDKFLYFFTLLYEKGIYMILSDKYLVEFSGKKEYIRHCLYGIRERNDHMQNRSFIVPSLGVLISSAWEHKHVVHVSKAYYQKEAFEEILKKSELFILE